MRTMNELFAPPTAEWRRPSRRYLALKLTLALVTWPLLIAMTVLPLLVVGPPRLWWITLIVLGLIWLWQIIRQPRVYRRWGYAETQTDIYLTRGLAWRQLTSIPYGRMQMVNVSAGPVERIFGVSNVELVTSSTSGTITIPGLDPNDAAALRDRLMERGELLQAGI